MSAPPSPKFNRGSVIVQPALTTGAETVTPAPAAPILTAIHPQVPTAQAAREPHVLERLLVWIIQQLRQLELAVGSHALAGGNHVRNIAIAANATKYIAHRLGRPYVGYVVTRAKRSSGTSSLVEEQALAAPYTSDKFLAIAATFTGVIDVYVF